MIINDELLQKSPKHRGFYSRLHAGHTATIRALIAAFRCQNTGIYSYKLLLTSQMSKQMDLQLLLMVTTVRCQNTGIHSYKLLQSDVLHRPTATVTAVRCQNTGIYSYKLLLTSQMSKQMDLQLLLMVTAARCQNTGIYSYKLLQSDVLHGPTATVTAVRCQNTGIQLQVTAVRCFTRAYSYSYCSQMSKHRDLQLQVTTQSSR